MSSWLSGFTSLAKPRLVSNIDEDLPAIHEGTLYFSNGLLWQTSHWKLVWRDDLKTQAMPVRFKSSADHQPIPGKSSCIPLSMIRTLVPFEKHEVEAHVARKPKASARSQNTRCRFAIETIDGSIIVLAAPDQNSRSTWLSVLYSTLISQAQGGLHQDQGVLDGTRACQQANERQRELTREIDRAMAGADHEDSREVLNTPHEAGAEATNRGDLIGFSDATSSRSPSNPARGPPDT
mmetsp:Transcript_68130/g.154134  ORF Transcript_68130/g.154134 Transcript_68130/m.154134 type:complete len:236 (-) Transcript_68130:180-887(-)